MSRFLKITLLALFGVLVAGAGTAWWLYRASQYVPDFYEEALVLEPESMEKAGDELERRVLALQNDFHHEGSWQAVFTAEQINGWLASDLEEKFPGLMPRTVRAPRVAIIDGQLHVACLNESHGVETIISFMLEPYLTENTNELAVRLHNLRAGSLPLPMGKALDRISRAAGRADLRLQWAQQEGDPIALVALPENSPELRRNYRVDQLEVRDGEIVISGHTSAPSALNAENACKELDTERTTQQSAAKVNLNDVR